MSLVLAQCLVMESESSKPEQKLSDYLWEQTVEYQQQALNSNLLYGMKERCLDPSEFGGYMVDDTVYCYEVMQCLRTAAERSNDNTTLQKYLYFKSESWKGVGAKSCNTWHIKNADGIKLGRAALAYIAHLRDVSENDSPIYMLLALTPCKRLWSWLGKQIGSGTKDFGVYTTWVERNFNPHSTGYLEYQDHVEWAYEAGVVTAEKALEVFTASIQSEVDFFNSVARCEPAESSKSVLSLYHYFILS